MRSIKFYCRTMESQIGGDTILGLQGVGPPLMQLPVLQSFATLCVNRGIHISKRRKNRKVIRQQGEARDPLSFIVVQWRARLEELKFQIYLLVH